MASQTQQNKYTIDFDKLLQTLLPFSLRRLHLMNVLFCMLAPVRRLHKDFVLFRKDKEERLAHNGQVCSLEAILNKKSSIRGIYITDGIYTKSVLIPASGESPYASYQVHLNPDEEETAEAPHPRIGTEDEYSGGYDFIVHLPAGLQNISYNDNRKKLQALTDLYKIAGKTYTFVYE